MNEPGELEHKGGGDVRPVRTIVFTLPRRLGDDADNPTYVFSELRGCCWIPAGENGSHWSEAGSG